MLERRYKSRIFRMVEIFYVNDIEGTLKKEEYKKNVDILAFEQVNVKYNDYFRPFYTLHIDLNQPEDEIFKKFKSNYRNEINKNLRDDNVEYRWVENPTLSEMEVIHKDLVSFSKFKGWYVNEELEMDRTKCFLDNLVVSHVKLNGVKIASHVYIVDEERTRLRFSVSYRTDESIDNKLVGRSNKGLHWFDIQQFKKMGMAIYDFGGAIRINEKGKIISSGVSGFKKGFSDNLVVEYVGEIPLTVKGKVAMFVWRFLKKIKNKRNRDSSKPLTKK